MASRTLDVRISGQDAGLSAALQKAGNAAKELGVVLNDLSKTGADVGKSFGKLDTSGFKTWTDQIKDLDSQINTVGKAMTGFGAGITAAIAVSVKNFASLEAAMANVGTIAGQSDAWLAGMTEQIKSLAVELGASPTGLAEGLYDLIGSGVQATDALDVLRVSATAAKAGLTDTGTAARAITSVLNAYGKSASEAGDVSDVLFKTVDSGVLTFEELAGSMGRALPLANILAVSIEELGAAYAEMTRQGLSASEAETSFTALLTAALNPTEALTRAVQEHGYASAEAMIQTEGFTAFLRFLDETAGGSATRMSELTGNVRATNGALILAQDGASGFVDRLTEMDEASGATALAFERQMDTIAGSTSRLQSSLSVLAATVGEAFAPFVQAGIDAAAGAVNILTNAIESLPGPLATVAAGLAGVTGGAALLAGGLLLMLPRIVETRAALQTLGGLRGVFGLLAGAVSPLGIAIASLGVGVLLVSENMRRGSESAKNYAASVEALTETIEELKLAGEGGRATFLQGLQAQVDASVAMLDEAKDSALTFYDDLNLAAQGIDPTQYSILLAGDFNRAIALADDANLRIGQALSNPNIDAEAYSAEVQRLLSTITVTAEGSNIDEVMQQILDIDLTKFRQGVGDARSELEKLGDITMDGLLASIDRLSDGEAMLATLADRVTDLKTQLDDLRIEGDLEIATQLESLNDLMLEGADSSEAYLDAQDRISDALVNGQINYASVAAEITRLNEEYARTGDLEAYEAGMIALSLSLSQYTSGSRNALEATAELTAEFANAALALGGWDNALSQLNMTGMTGDLGRFAEEGIRAGQAFDNTFRILVTNVQQYGQSIQSATDWMEDLVAVNDEGWSKVNQLAAEERITWEQRDAAVAAYNQTLEANYDIQQNLLAVQALQAPYIAESVVATQAWVAELAQMPAEVQRTALAFADLQTVQTAQEIITLGNSDAFKAMGDNGVAAFTQVIQGALQTNPLLFNVLETMGIINGTPLDFTVNMDALKEAGGAMDALIANIGNLVDTLREIYGLPPIEIEADVSGVEDAQTQLNSLRDIVRDPTGWAVKIAVDPNVTTTGGGTTPFGPGTFAGDYAAGWRQFLGIPDTVDVPVDVSVSPTIQVNGALPGVTPGSSLGADAFKAMLGVPDEVNTLITATVAGAADVESVSDSIDALPDSKNVAVSVDMDATSISDVMTLLDTINTAGAATMTVDVVIGTNELDTGLAGWGIGTGGGGGGARYERKTVTIDVLADTAQAATDIATLMLLVNTTEASTIHVDADVSAAQTAIDGLSGGGDESSKITLMVDANVSQAQMKIDGLDGRFDTAPKVTVMVDADTSAASEALLGLAAAAQAASGIAVSIPVDAPGSGDTIAQLVGVAGAATAADALSVSVPVATPGSGDGIAQLQGVAGAAAAADALTVSIPVSVSGAGAAVNALLSVAQAAASIPSSVSTTITTNRVTNNIQTYSTVGASFGARLQHGGIPSYATGGVLFRAAEGNRPEVAHFAGGGTALLPRDGLYMAPPMTYISPHNSDASYGGDTYQGDTIELHIHGNVYAIDELADAMEGALSRRRRGYGLGASA